MVSEIIFLHISYHGLREQPRFGSLFAGYHGPALVSECSSHLQFSISTKKNNERQKQSEKPHELFG